MKIKLQHVILVAVIALGVMLLFSWQMAASGIRPFATLGSNFDDTHKSRKNFWPYFYQIHGIVRKIDGVYYLTNPDNTQDKIEISEENIEAFANDCLPFVVTVDHVLEPRWFLGRDNIISHVEMAYLFKMDVPPMVKGMGNVNDLIICYSSFWVENGTPDDLMGQ